MLLWGSKAHDIVFSCIKDKNFKKQKHNTNPQIIPETNIMLLQSSHPSPIAVNTGGDFLRIAPLHFKECDKHLGKNKINWTIL